MIHVVPATWEAEAGESLEPGRRIYFIHGLTLEVYFGYLEKDFEVYGDENPLLWIDVNSNFFDIDKFAGKGNLGHFMEMMKDLEVK